MIGTNLAVKTVQGNTDLELQPPSGKSYRIQAIQVYNPASNYAKAIVDRSTVAYYRVGGNLGNHLPFRIQDVSNYNLMEYLIDNAVFRPIPVASGQLFKITGVAQAGAVQVVVYSEHAEGEVRNTEPNGSMSKDIDYINYGQYASATLADGENAISVQISPSEFPAFPFGADVPSRSKITIFGILASDVGVTSGTAANKQASSYLKLRFERETLFDEDLNGLPIIGSAPATDGSNFGVGQSLIGNYSSVDLRPPLFFPKPLVFEAGEELELLLNTPVSLGVANIAKADAEIGLICRLERM